MCIDKIIKPSRQAFTLIELAIVLVIIGLLVAGVLAGKHLVDESKIRAQISQLNRYNLAFNTFRMKYKYMPGDIKNPMAASLGLQPGNGDGTLTILYGGCCYWGTRQLHGELPVAWVDMSAMGMIEESFTTATITQIAGPVTAANIGTFYPEAKIGNGNYVYLWSGGYNSLGANDGFNYFGISVPLFIATNGNLYANPGLKVTDAYSIDAKIDNGLPQSGTVTTMHISSDNQVVWSVNPGSWVGGTPYSPTGPNIGASAAKSANSCYDNNGVAGATTNYSTDYNAGKGVNCAISVRLN